MSKNSLPYAKYIIEQIDWLKQLEEQHGDAIFSDRLIYNSMLYSLFTLADAASKIPEQLKNEFSQIDWAQIKGFRNVIVHEYLGMEIDQDIVKFVLRAKLPELKIVMQDLLNKINR